MDIKNLTDEEAVKLWRLSGLSQANLALALGVDFKRLHSKINNAQQREIRDRGREVLKPSPYPVYDKPLETEGDAVVLPDPEFPFHEADFLNRVLDLADKWRIPNCVIAGDVLHFNSISKWEPAWLARPSSGMPEAQQALLLEYANKLPKKEREGYLEAILGTENDNGGNDIGSEVECAKTSLERLGHQFIRVDYVIGNHDGRFLSALNSPLFADKLLDFIGLSDPKFRIAPYYFSHLISGGQTWRIEHPKGAAKNTASGLASKYLCNVAMGHSHRWSMEFDKSGNFYAIHMGCCVDERRLPYCAQRSNSSDAHSLGALIIRDGYPFLLSANTPWDRYAKM